MTLQLMSSFAAVGGLEGLEKKMNQSSRYKTLYLGLTWTEANEMGAGTINRRKQKAETLCHGK